MKSSDLAIQGFELVVALVAVLSEHRLAKEKSSGWILAILASILAGIFFFFISKHYTLGLLEILSIPFAIYGFHKWKNKIKEITKTDNIMAFSAFGVIIIYFLIADSDIHETISSSFFIIGGLLIARNKKFGWYINIIADVLLAYILLENNDYIFVCFQMLSIFIACRKTILKNLLAKRPGINSGLSLSFYVFETGAFVIKLRNFYIL